MILKVYIHVYIYLFRIIMIIIISFWIFHERKRILNEGRNEAQFVCNFLYYKCIEMNKKMKLWLNFSISFYLSTFNSLSDIFIIHDLYGSNPIWQIEILGNHPINSYVIFMFNDNHDGEKKEAKEGKKISPKKKIYMNRK